MENSNPRNSLKKNIETILDPLNKLNLPDLTQISRSKFRLQTLWYDNRKPTIWWCISYDKKKYVIFQPTMVFLREVLIFLFSFLSACFTQATEFWTW